MLIDSNICIGCGQCFFYCPVEAIFSTDKRTSKGKEIRAVDLEKCVECGTCLHARICPVDVISQQSLEWPRTADAMTEWPNDSATQ